MVVLLTNKPLPVPKTRTPSGDRASVVCLTGAWISSILRLLMSLESPSPLAQTESRQMSNIGEHSQPIGQLSSIWTVRFSEHLSLALMHARDHFIHTKRVNGAQLWVFVGESPNSGIRVSSLGQGVQNFSSSSVGLAKIAAWSGIPLQRSRCT
jgi:hypothetical protein